MKRVIIYALLCLMIIGGTITVFSFDKEDEEHVVKVFADTKFLNTASSVECVVNYGQGNLTKAQIKKIVEDIAKELGIKDGYSYGKEKNDSGKVMSLHRKGLKSEVYIKLLSVSKKKIKENYIMVNIILDNSIESALFYKQKLYDNLSKYEENPNIIVNLVGTLPGKLTRQEKNKMAEDLLNKTGSKLVIDGRNEEIYTIYGYTKKVKEFVPVGDDKVNLNIAITYLEDEGVSKVYLSTPIINLDY